MKLELKPEQENKLEPDMKLIKLQLGLQLKLETKLELQLTQKGWTAT